MQILVEHIDINVWWPNSYSTIKPLQKKEGASGINYKSNNQTLESEENMAFTLSQRINITVSSSVHIYLIFRLQSVFVSAIERKKNTESWLSFCENTV